MVALASHLIGPVVAVCILGDSLCPLWENGAMGCLTCLCKKQLSGLT